MASTVPSSSPTAAPAVAAPGPQAAPQRTLLELTGIGKTFHTDDVETRALSNVELTVTKGEFVSISGPSGSGKSTLLAILGLLDVPTHGEYRIDGNDSAKLDPVKRAALRNRSIGFIFQAFNLIGDLTVEENVELPLTYGGMDKAERKKRVAEALDAVRMSHRARHLPGQLSGGQQQRVAVARAVAGDPLILLADEPTGNLDSKNGDAVMELLCQMHASGSTIIMVTHNPDYATKATRIVHLFDGRVVEDRRGV
ncbi:MAG: ABC transporter ATP-binding protein [Myxococcota bacterium]|nr:ABC transporter ATP-binding protein [Myxococcota bacterium]